MKTPGNESQKGTAHSSTEGIVCNNCKGMKEQVTDLQKKITELESQPGKGGETKNLEAINKQLELRLTETLAEAKRSYDSYISMREQYNAFLQGRINQLMDYCLNTPNSKADPTHSSKLNKAKSDAIQQLKVNLEAQEQMLEHERKQLQASSNKVSIPSPFSNHSLYRSNTNSWRRTTS